MEDTRNIIDYYKGWELEAIKADLDTKRSEMISMVVNLSGDFNKSSVIRANNAFLGKRVIIAGKKRWDKRGAVGTHHYEHLEYWNDPVKAMEHYAHKPFAHQSEGYFIYPVDNTPEYEPLPLYGGRYWNDIEPIYF